MIKVFRSGETEIKIGNEQLKSLSCRFIYSHKNNKYSLYDRGNWRQTCENLEGQGRIIEAALCNLSIDRFMVSTWQHAI